MNSRTEGRHFPNHGGQRNHPHLLAQPTLDGNENNLVQTVRRIEGAYSLVIMTEQELIGVRDPFGFRPLCLGKVATPGCWPAKPARLT
jgi:glutamine phosphoribosylpyrophosphate amidotransferase